MAGLFGSKILFVLFLLGFAFLAISFFIVLLNAGTLAKPVLLHADPRLGVREFGNRGTVWEILGAGVAFMLVNVFLSGALYRRERILSYLIMGSGALVSLLTLVVLGFIISANI